MVLTPKHLAFCANIVLGQKPKQAYENAGFSKNGSGPSACRLLKLDEICTEIATRRAKGAVYADLTVAKVLANIEHGIELAEDLGQPSAYLKGVELQAKYLGMLTEKRELTGKNGGPMQVDATVRQGVLTAEEREALKTKLKGILD
jgi:phage terminase small subunit